MLKLLIRAFVALFVVLPIKLFVVLPAKVVGVLAKGLGACIQLLLLPLRLILLPLKVVT